jgi:hypothetical protein
MATYGLYLGKLQGEVLLHKRYRTTRPAGSVGFDTAVLSELGMSHDPYRTRTWSGESLQDLRQQADNALSRRERKIRETTKARMRKPEIDSWMLPVIQQEIASDRCYKALCELLQLVERAAIENGTIIYWSD